jgi:hypothetical protein
MNSLRFSNEQCNVIMGLKTTYLQQQQQPDSNILEMKRTLAQCQLSLGLFDPVIINCEELLEHIKPKSAQHTVTTGETNCS